MISIIVAYSINKTIGKDGDMPWDIPADLTHFKKLTKGNVVIMGRKTYESIGKILPNRVNIILSKNPDYRVCGGYVASNIQQAISLAKKFDDKEIFIAGGSAIYVDTIDMADRIYVTLVEKEYDGDTFFPQFDEILFDKQITGGADTPVPYKFITYTRK